MYAAWSPREEMRKPLVPVLQAFGRYGVWQVADADRQDDGHLAADGTVGVDFDFSPEAKDARYAFSWLTEDKDCIEAFVTLPMSLFDWFEGIVKLAERRDLVLHMSATVKTNKTTDVVHRAREAMDRLVAGEYLSVDIRSGSPWMRGVQAGVVK